MNATEFDESARSSVTQQTFAVLVASLFRRNLLRCTAFYFRAPYAPTPKFGGALVASPPRTENPIYATGMNVGRESLFCVEL